MNITYFARNIIPSGGTSTPGIYIYKNPADLLIVAVFTHCIKNRHAVCIPSHSSDFMQFGFGNRGTFNMDIGHPPQSWKHVLGGLKMLMCHNPAGRSYRYN